MTIIQFLLAWVLGLLMGAFGTAVYTWWSLVTGRRTVTPLNEVIAPYREWWEALCKHRQVKR